MTNDIRDQKRQGRRTLWKVFLHCSKQRRRSNDNRPGLDRRKADRKTGYLFGHVSIGGCVMKKVYSRYSWHFNHRFVHKRLLFIFPTITIEKDGAEFTISFRWLFFTIYVYRFDHEYIPF